MFKADVIAHFEGSPVAVARALGITRSAVNQWPKRVPLKSALRLHALTHGALPIDMSDYQLPDLAARAPDESLRASA